MKKKLQKLRPKPPIRRYKTLNDVKKSIAGHLISKFENTWPCPACGGKGKVRDPSERCPIEGYKLAGWYTCSACGGDGTTTKDKIQEIYQQELDKYKEERAAYDETYAIFKSIQGKLSDDEITYLTIVMDASRFSNPLDQWMRSRQPNNPAKK